MIAVVTSGKGGAGKSTVSAGLACALARQDKQVLVIDADAGLRSLDLMLGIEEQAVHDLSDIFARRCEPAKAIYPSSICKGVFVIPAPPTLDGLCTPAEMRHLCRGLSKYYDVILIDCPAGIGRGFRTAIAGAERAIIVTTPDMVCARDAQIVSTHLDEAGIPCKMVINRLRSKPVMRGKMPDIDEVMDSAQVPLLGVIPDDEAVAIANANGAPLPWDCHASRCFVNIAQRFCGVSVPLANLSRM